MSAERIVIVNFTRMGDLIQSGPLMRRLRRSNPGSRLTLLVLDKFRDVASRLPMVDEAVGFPVDELVRALDRRHGDLSRATAMMNRFVEESGLAGAGLVCNLSHTPLSATLCHLLSPVRAMGMVRDVRGQMRIEGEWFSYLLSVMQERSMNPFNLVEMYLNMAPAADDAPSLEFATTSEDDEAARILLLKTGVSVRKPYIVLQPGASSPSRQWPVRSFAELALALQKRGYQSVVVGTTEERKLAEEICGRAEGAAVSLSGQTPLGVLGSVLKSAFALVSNDTGTIHLAAAVDTRSIGIYLGPASAKDTAPYGNGHLILEPDSPCAPCSYQRECHGWPCHQSVSAAAVESLLFAEAREIRYVGQSLSGVRAFQTHVEIGGAFRLERLNDPATGRDDVWLDFYREFWTALIGRRGEISLPEAGLCRELCRHTDAIRELRAISLRARDAVALLARAAANRDAGTEDLTRCVSDQARWQNELRMFVTRDAEITALPRLILTRLTAVRGARLAEYLEDLQSSVALLTRGTELQSRVLTMAEKRIHRYAEAV